MPPTLDRETIPNTVGSVEAARRLGVTRMTIVNWIKSDIIRAGRIGKRYYIPKREIDRLLDTMNGIVNDDAA